MWLWFCRVQKINPVTEPWGVNITKTAGVDRIVYMNDQQCNPDDLDLLKKHRNFIGAYVQ